MTIDLRLGDCLEVMKELPDASVDCVLTDPPYGLEFMGKEWDAWDRRSHLTEENEGVATFLRSGKNLKEYRAGSSFQDWCSSWGSECLRVLKTGGFLLSFGGTRTHHRLTCGLEDAGFMIRDEIDWVYFSGFPKAQDLTKLMDRRRLISDVIPIKKALKEAFEASGKTMGEVEEECGFSFAGYLRTTYRDDDGWGSAVPFGLKWVKVKEVLKFDSLSKFDSLITEIERTIVKEGHAKFFSENKVFEQSKKDGYYETKPIDARSKEWVGWKTPALKPAHEPIVVCQKPCEGSIVENVLKHGVGGFNVDACRIPFENEGDKTSSKVGFTGSIANGITLGGGQNTKVKQEINTAGRFPANVVLTDEVFNEQSKFFLIPKTSRSEKEKGIEGIEEYGCYGNGIGNVPKIDGKRPTKAKNTHPTVKPVRLMEWLVKLCTKPDALVLDPFMGSGTTGLACKALSRNFIGIEKDENYFKIAQERLAVGKDLNSFMEGVL